jgi:predicted amidohydrolase YtcJ
VLYPEPLEVANHIAACTEAGLQAGFHAIGDDALAVLLNECFSDAADEVGLDRIRAARHRIEHAEMLDSSLIAELVRYGIVACVQPAFDAAWGGPDGMYAERLGVERAMTLNPYAALMAAGVPLAFGSDSPVTPLDPWGTIRAAEQHRTPASRITGDAAFAAHTLGGWYAARREQEGAGELRPDAPATYAIWQDGEPPTCLRTVVRGQTVYEKEGGLG